MEKVRRLLRGYRHICFLDFEGTQFSHEMIAFGAMLTTVDKNGLIVKEKKPIKYYVKCKNQIGKFVKNLTGITEKDLEKHGVARAAFHCFCSNTWPSMEGISFIYPW